VDMAFVNVTNNVLEAINNGVVVVIVVVLRCYVIE